MSAPPTRSGRPAIAANRTPILKHIGTHISSNAIGYVALFVALSGSAYAVGLAESSVKSKHIKNGQVKAADTNADQVQARIDQACAPGSTIRVIARDGTVLCEPDDLGAGGLPAGPAGGDLNDSYPDPTLRANTVTSGHVIDNSIMTADLGSSSVTNAKIANGSVDAAKLGAVITRSSNCIVVQNTLKTCDASCAAGEELLGGGGGFEEIAVGGLVKMVSSQRVGSSQTWRVRVEHGYVESELVQVDAICLV